VAPWVGKLGELTNRQMVALAGNGQCLPVFGAALVLTVGHLVLRDSFSSCSPWLPWPPTAQRPRPWFQEAPAVNSPAEVHTPSLAAVLSRASPLRDALPVSPAEQAGTVTQSSEQFVAEEAGELAGDQLVVEEAAETAGDKSQDKEAAEPAGDKSQDEGTAEPAGDEHQAD
jgi:hypothetical protein